MRPWAVAAALCVAGVVPVLVITQDPLAGTVPDGRATAAGRPAGPTDDATPATAPDPSTTPDPTTTPTAGPGSTVPPTTSGDAGPSADDPGAAPDPGSATGPGLTEPGVALFTTLDVDGTVLVEEQVLLDEPRSVLELAAPRPAEELAGASGDGPVATDVQLSADGLGVGVPDGTVAEPVEVETVPSFGFSLRYRLTGATIVSEPSSSGRALVVLGPLASGLPGRLPVQVVVTGPSVRNVYCPLLPPAEAACASGAAPRFTLARPLPYADARVEVQFDLPRG